MDKKVIIFLTILFFISPVFAEVEFEVEDSKKSNDASFALAQQQLQQYKELSEQMNEIKAENASNLEASVNYLDAKISAVKTGSLIVFVVVSLAVQGISWAAFLYLKSRKLL